SPEQRIAPRLGAFDTTPIPRSSLGVPGLAPQRERRSPVCRVELSRPRKVAFGQARFQAQARVVWLVAAWPTSLTLSREPRASASALAVGFLAARRLLRRVGQPTPARLGTGLPV